MVGPASWGVWALYIFALPWEPNRCWWKNEGEKRSTEHGAGAAESLGTINGTRILPSFMEHHPKSLSIIHTDWDSAVAGWREGSEGRWERAWGWEIDNFINNFIAITTSRCLLVLSLVGNCQLSPQWSFPDTHNAWQMLFQKVSIFNFYILSYVGGYLIKSILSNTIWCHCTRRCSLLAVLLVSGSSVYLKPW